VQAFRAFTYTLAFSGKQNASWDASALGPNEGVPCHFARCDSGLSQECFESNACAHWDGRIPKSNWMGWR